MFKLLKYSTFIFSAIFLLGCSLRKTNVQQNPIVPNVEMIYPQDPNRIKTTKGANELDLETPLRCYVNWETQEMISAIPYNVNAFKLRRNGRNDAFPKFDVNGFSFETMPAEKAFKNLLKEADIKVVVQDGPYTSISAENLRGELSGVMSMLADAAEVYYSYNSDKRQITLHRKANYSLSIPHSRMIMLGLLDVLRGAGISDITVNWEDYTITLDADYELVNKIQNLIKYFTDNPLLITYDVSVLRLYPYNGQDVKWQELLKSFEFGAIKTTKTGVIGRVMTSSNNINLPNLQSFLSQQARVELISQGKFIVPEQWYSRFDVGKCGKRDVAEAELSILARTNFDKSKNLIFAEVTLDSTYGEITKFNLRSKLGDNFIIFGIPNQIFNDGEPHSETVVFMVPRIIKTLKTNKAVSNNF
jgi:hypothetical protein